MVVAFMVPRAWLRSAAISGLLCCAAALTSCDSGSAASSREPSAEATTRSGGVVSPPVGADRLRTDSAAQTATEIIGRREFVGHGVLRDGTMLTVWADGRGYDGSAGVRRAFRLQSPSGQVRTGRLPDGHPTGWGNDRDSVATTAAGFVVLGSPDVLLARDGTFGPFRPGRGRRFEDGDVLVSSTPRRVRLLRPRSRTEHALTLDRNVEPLAVGAGRLYGFLECTQRPIGPTRSCPRRLLERQSARGPRISIGYHVRSPGRGRRPSRGCLGVRRGWARGRWGWRIVRFGGFLGDSRRRRDVAVSGAR